MAAEQFSPLGRRAFLAGAAATGILALPGCASIQHYSLVDAIRRLLMRASQQALARLSAPGGFWDNEIARLDLPDAFGNRGSILQGILTSGLLKQRLQRELNHVAEAGARRAAPIIADAVQMIGVDNALALVRGGPTAATEFLRGAMAGGLVEAMVPPLGEGLRLVRDPLVGEVIAALTGVDVSGVAQDLAVKTDNAIWGEIGREEAMIRAHPESTNDIVLMDVFKQS